MGVSKHTDEPSPRMESQGDGEKAKERLAVVLLCLFWCIWKEHNHRISMRKKR